MTENIVPDGNYERTLVLERRDQEDRTPVVGHVMMTPGLGADYWSYRVVLSEKQAVVGFPKFFTVGIGFAVEEDWNTNLPYTSDAEAIARHIGHNKGDDSIADEDVLAAIRLIQEAARVDMKGDS